MGVHYSQEDNRKNEATFSNYSLDKSQNKQRFRHVEKFMQLPLLLGYSSFSVDFDPSIENDFKRGSVESDTSLCFKKPKVWPGLRRQSVDIPPNTTERTKYVRRLSLPAQKAVVKLYSDFEPSGCASRPTECAMNLIEQRTKSMDITEFHIESSGTCSHDPRLIQPSVKGSLGFLIGYSAYFIWLV